MIDIEKIQDQVSMYRQEEKSKNPILSYPVKERGQRERGQVFTIY